jgi:organic radical activating enzyme
MNISLAPSFYCNFRCSWCYLGEHELSNMQCIDLTVLQGVLDTIGNIEHVDIYGGEPSLLPKHFVDNLLSLLKNYTQSINVISNFSAVPEWFHRSDITVSASYDWTMREKHDKVLTNIIGFSKPIPLLMLATDQLCLVDPVDIAEVLNSISTVGSLEIKPYSQNRFNSYEMDWTVFEEWIKKWLELDLNFELINRRLLEESVSKQYNAFSDNHLYIMPNGDMNVLDFDLNDREYFKLIPTMADYYKWVEQEREMIKNNKFCKNCQWQGHCATEHYRNVKSLDKSCNGFKHLLDWYARLEN